MKSQQAFLVKIWLTTLRSIRTWVQCQGISSFFSSCTTINKRKFLFSEAYLADCILVELTFEQAEREGKITRLQSASIWRNDGGNEMDEYWVGKGLGVRERTGMPLLWLFLPCPALPFPTHSLLSLSLSEASWWITHSGVGRWKIWNTT